jgi:hypothetical protein
MQAFHCFAAVAVLFVFATPGAAGAEELYNPRIDPKDFSVKIDNPYFSLAPGKHMVFEGKSEDGMERDEISITGETRTIMGVETLLYFDQVWVDGVVKEVTRDYLAQDKAGNVWYFGEDVDNYENGKFKDHHGGWIAGKKGAKPGIWMKAAPVSGDSYRQEFSRGEAEDHARVIATDATVKVKAGTFEKCVSTFEWTPLEPDAKELKYFCPGAGGQVLTEDLETGARSQLVKVDPGS